VNLTHLAQNSVSMTTCVSYGENAECMIEEEVSAEVLRTQFSSGYAVVP
jgi:hypothetical protein